MKLNTFIKIHTPLRQSLLLVGSCLFFKTICIKNKELIKRYAGVPHELNHSISLLGESFAPSGVKKLSLTYKPPCTAPKNKGLLKLSSRCPSTTCTPTVIEKYADILNEFWIYHKPHPKDYNITPGINLVKKRHWSHFQTENKILFTNLINQLIETRNMSPNQYNDIRRTLMRLYETRINYKPQLPQHLPSFTNIPNDIWYEILFHLTNGESKKAFFEKKKTHKEAKALFRPVVHLAMTCKKLHLYIRENSWENGIPFLRYMRLAMELKIEDYEWETYHPKKKYSSRLPTIKKIEYMRYFHRFSTKETYKLFAQALGEGSEKHIKYLLQKFEINLRHVWYKEENPLSVAAYLNNLTLIKLFIKHGVDPLKRAYSSHDYPIQKTRDMNCILEIFRSAPKEHIKKKVIFKVMEKLRSHDLEILTRELSKYY